MYKIFEVRFNGELLVLPHLRVSFQKPNESGQKDIPNTFASIEEAMVVMKEVYKNSQKVYYLSNLKRGTNYVILPTFSL